MFKPPGNPKVLELTKSIKGRSYNLYCLSPIKLEELNEKGKPKRLCAWCSIGELYSGNQKYCCKNCSDSANAWAYPQKEDSLRFLLLRQEWKCQHCQYDYRPFLELMMEKDRKKYSSSIEIEELPWYYLKRLKRQVPKDRKPEVDHIIPIYKGGASLGLDNHQAICFTCHKNKTKLDLSGKRDKGID